MRFSPSSKRSHRAAATLACAGVLLWAANAKAEETAPRAPQAQAQAQGQSRVASKPEAFDVMHPIKPPRYGAALPELRFPAPFVLPELSHPLFDARVDWFVGRHASETDVRPHSIAGILRPSVEASVFVPRRVYVGLTYPIAIAMPPDGGLAPGEAGTLSGARTMLGNVEGHVRALFPLPTFLEIGFTLAVVAPTATFNRDLRPNRSASDAAGSFDPTNFAHFLPGRVTLRPAGDLRILRGPFVFQGRHGIDVIIDDIGLDHVRVAGRLLGHAGILVRRDVEVSVEGSQIYFFASDDKVTGPSSPETAFAEKYRISDERRAAFTIGPGVRFAYRDVDIGASVITNIGTPLSPVSDHFVALRLSVIGHIGRMLESSYERND